MRARADSKKLIMACIGLLLGPVTVGSVQAACSKADLTGVWYGTGVSGNVVGSYFDITNQCKITVNSRGRVVASKSSCTYYDWTGSGASNITGGALSISSACAITGSVTICEPTGCGSVRISAHMERSKMSFPAQAYSVANRGFRYILNFVKR